MHSSSKAVSFMRWESVLGREDGMHEGSEVEQPLQEVRRAKNIGFKVSLEGPRWGEPGSAAGAPLCLSACIST